MQKTTIKNINLYQINNKFNINMQFVTIPNININFIPFNSSIYRYIYSNSNLTNNDIFLINASILNDEIKQFIMDIGDKIKIYIIEDKQLDETTSQIERFAKILKLPKHIINSQLYNDQNAQDKIDRIVYFHDPLKSDLPSKLNELLYPNTLLPIIIFDGINIKHPLSIGSTSELDKKYILSESKYYLHDNDHYYVHEAILSNCECLNLDSENSIEDQIKNKNIYNYQNIINNSTNYLDFLMDIIYEK